MLLLPFLFCQEKVLSQSGKAGCDSASITRIIGQAKRTSSDTAESLYKKAIQKAKDCLGSGSRNGKKGITKTLIKAYLGLGLNYYQGLAYDKALQNYDAALLLAKSLDDPYEIAECIFNFAEVFLEQSHYKEAMEKYQESMEYYVKANDKSGSFWCYTGMGIVQKQIGNLKDAIICYNKALDVAIKSGQKDETAICYNNLGNVYRKRGDFSKAMESYQKAITQFRDLKDDVAASDCMNNIGNLYLDNGDPFRALDYYNQSLKIVKAKNDEYRLIIRYKNLADAYADLKDYENAEQFLKDALKLAEKSGDKSFLASCYMQTGKLYSIKNDRDIAIAYYNKSYKLFEQIGAKAEQADALVEIANLELSGGEINSAIRYAKDALSLAKQTGTLKAQLEANDCLSNCYEKNGDAKQALSFLKEVITYKDSIYSSDKYRTIEEIEAGFVQHELKKENTALTQNSLLQKQAIRTRNSILFLLLLCLILSIALVWLVYKRQKEAKRKSGIIKQQHEQKIEKLNEDLTTKERELTSKTVFINQKNQLLERLINELEELKKNEISGAAIQHLQVQLKQELAPNAWKEFEVQFNEVHPGFQTRLIEQYPELTPAERRLCSFIRLDMNTREISSLTGHSIKSIEVARTRVRKKLSVPHEHNLNNSISLI
ncbi:MAG: tetratricopeptide repeat protein [Bacteroidetes bacterium]|nr:tetratricopeptide repeat protein [Bacteroidota bacterium]